MSQEKKILESDTVIRSAKQTQVVSTRTNSHTHTHIRKYLRTHPQIHTNRHLEEREKRKLYVKSLPRCKNYHSGDQFK